MLSPFSDVSREERWNLNLGRIHSESQSWPGVVWLVSQPAIEEPVYRRVVRRIQNCVSPIFSIARVGSSSVGVIDDALGT